MKKILFIITLFLSSFSFLPSFAQNSEGGVDGLHTDKTSEFKDGVGTITLDTFVEGEVKVVQGNPAPCDIVLVLDLSGSMTQPFGSKTRLEAMKDACKSFLNSIAENAVANSVDHKVAIVSFNEYRPPYLTGYGEDYLDGTVVWPQHNAPNKHDPYGGTEINMDESSPNFGVNPSHNVTKLKMNPDSRMPVLYNYVITNYSDYFIPANAKDGNLDASMTVSQHIVDCLCEADTGKGLSSTGNQTACFRGMEEAYNLLFNKRKKRTYVDGEGIDQQRPTFVILFTDGIPGQTDPAKDPTDTKFSDEKGKLSISYAYNTIVYANQLKKKGTSVYTVGIHPKCNPVPSSPSDPFFIRLQFRSNSVGSFYYYNSTNKELTYDDPVNCDNALNCFLHMVSSNYTGDDDTEAIYVWKNYDNTTLQCDNIRSSYEHNYLNIKAKGMGRWAVGSSGESPAITSAQKKQIVEGGHYLSASNPDGLNKIFEDISDDIIKIVTIDLGTETILKDFIDNTTFALPEGTKKEHIKVYTREITSIEVDPVTGKNIYTFEPVPDNPRYLTEEDGIKIEFVTDTSGENEGVTISGFNYSENWVGYDQHSQLHGCELEVLIPFTFQEGVEIVDGTYQTNTPESGIYDGDGEIVQPYPVPEIQIWDLIITRNDLELGESVVYDVFTANSSTDYSQTKPIYRVVLTGTSVDGLEPVSETITGVIAYQNEKYLYYRVEETGWSWAYALQHEQPQIKTYLDNHLNFVFSGEHDPASFATDPLNKLLHTEVINKNGSLEYPTN